MSLSMSKDFSDGVFSRLLVRSQQGHESSCSPGFSAELARRRLPAQRLTERASGAQESCGSAREGQIDVRFGVDSSIARDARFSQADVEHRGTIE